ncbi:MAG TPA: phosphatase PAP2 family protein [Pyrinomonadaceae bacterium]|jgi:membrane-associated phospholipid phosphatase
MNYLSTILILITATASRLTSIDDYLFETINGIAGRSWIFDNLLVLPYENNLVKAGVICACFLYAWLKGSDEAEIARRRRILLITVIASFFVIATTKTLSKTVFLPRPFIQSEKTFHLEGDQLVESRHLNWRVPLDEESQKNFKELKNGEIIQNDLGTFPSDHAGFYMTLAVGILLACRSAGLLALFWTLFVTLGSRIVTGQHSPLDILVGSTIGIGILLTLQFVIGNLGKRLIDPIVNWTLKYSALSSAVIFIFIFEAGNTLENIRPLLKLVKDIAKHLIKG